MYHPVHSTFIDMQTGITIAGILTLILGAYVVFRKRQQTQKFPIILIVLLIFLFLIMIFMWMGYSKIYTAHMPIWQNAEHQLATQMEQHE